MVFRCAFGDQAESQPVSCRVSIHIERVPLKANGKGKPVLSRALTHISKQRRQIFNTSIRILREAVTTASQRAVFAPPWSTTIGDHGASSWRSIRPTRACASKSSMKKTDRWSITLFAYLTARVGADFESLSEPHRHFRSYRRHALCRRENGFDKWELSTNRTNTSRSEEDRRGKPMTFKSAG